MTQLVLSNAVVVTPNGVVEGSVVAEDGLITTVVPRDIPGGIDLAGAIVSPGFIDLHNDGLEVEINPRPGVGLPLEFALHNFDLRAAGAGLTMAFHAITFANFEKKDRSVETADERARAIRALAQAQTIVVHQVLFRADAWQPEGLPLLLERIQDWDTRIVTIKDHTPGQGQYRDIDSYERFIQDWAGRGPADVERSTKEKMAFVREHPEVAERTFKTLRDNRVALDLVIGSHDDDTAERCGFLHLIGATIAEFPVTVEAAETARQLGMTIVAGAPNIVRGGSHSGNVSALELVERGLCDVLVADYHAPSLLLAVQYIVERGVLGLAEAIAMISTNPARLLKRQNIGGSSEKGSYAHARSLRSWERLAGRRDRAPGSAPGEVRTTHPCGYASAGLISRGVSRREGSGRFHLKPLGPHQIDRSTHPLKSTARWLRSQ